MHERLDGISRRQALKTVALGGTVLGGAAWVAPSIITSVVAQAAGSGTTTTSSSVEGTTVVPATTSTTTGSTSTTSTTTEPSGVLGNQAGTQAGTLPRTGMDVAPVVATGVGLIVGGAVIAEAAKRLPDLAAEHD